MCKIKSLKRSHFCFSSRGLKRTNYRGKTYLIKELEFAYGNILLYFEYKEEMPLLMSNISSGNYRQIRKYVDYLSYCKRRNIDNVIQDKVNKNKLINNHKTRDMELFDIRQLSHNNRLVMFRFHYV